MTAILPPPTACSSTTAITGLHISTPPLAILSGFRGRSTSSLAFTQMEYLDAGTVCETGFQPVATNVFARDFNANAEAYEGMYVRFPRQLFVTDTYNQHSYGEVWLGEKGVVEQPTNEYPAGPDSEALAAGQHGPQRAAR